MPEIQETAIICVVGPESKEKVDKVTGKLKLL